MSFLSRVLGIPNTVLVLVACNGGGPVEDPTEGTSPIEDTSPPHDTSTPLDTSDSGTTDTGTVALPLAIEDADLAMMGSGTERAGRSIAGVGDLDGDGTPDLVIGTAFGNLAYLVSGQTTGTVDLSTVGTPILGEVIGDQAGDGTAAAGDVNGDGFDDVMVGAPYAEDRGAVYVIHGPISGPVNLADADAKWVGEDYWSGVGSNLAGAGDVDGDGFDDVLIGTSTTNGHMGIAYLIYGPTTGNQGLQQADVEFSRDLLFFLDGAQAHTSVSGAGDVDGDGFDDVVIGTHGCDPLKDVHQTCTAGAAYVLRGPLLGDVSMSDADATLTGEAIRDQAGWDVSGAGDTDGDGLADVIVGARQRGGFVGGAYLVLGPVPQAADLADADAVLPGGNGDHWAGESVDGAGDVDGDGFDDLLVGVSRGTEGNDLVGVAHLLYGPVSGQHALADSDLRWRLDDTAEWDASGIVVAGAGDVDGDNLADILVGTSMQRVGKTSEDHSGAAYLILQVP